MTPRAYYNDFDKDAAAWLRELIDTGRAILREIVRDAGAAARGGRTK
jgi:hypothetical protein